MAGWVGVVVHVEGRRGDHGIWVIIEIQFDLFVEHPCPCQSKSPAKGLQMWQSCGGFPPTVLQGTCSCLLDVA